MTNKTEAQPEALRLADSIDPITRTKLDNLTLTCAATELRFQHAEIQELKAQQSSRQAAQLIIARKEGTVDFVKEILAEAADELRKTTAPDDYEIEDRTCYAKDLDAIATMLSAAPPAHERESRTDEWHHNSRVESAAGIRDALSRMGVHLTITTILQLVDITRKAHEIGATNDR